MAVHEYSIIGHRRSDVGRWLGAASVFLAPILTSIITSLSQWHVLTQSLQGKMAAFTLSAGTIYGALYLVFDRSGWAWRVFDKVLRIPDLRGNWEVTGESLNLDNAVRFHWSGTLNISQRWDTIAIELDTGQSASSSETASLLVQPNGKAKLSYSYQNHPKVGQAELEKHQGFCELIFDATRSSAEGHYFNSMGRYSFGRMQLQKILD
jgi:hypothetical protein